MKKIVSTFLFILFVHFSFSQISTIISGKVVDKETGESLPYANIIYLKKSLGTISNLEGDFTLALSNAQKLDSVVISYMGYISFKATLGECLNVDFFRLSPHLNKIAEIKVNAEKFRVKPFMKEVIIEYNKNRRKTPHIAIAHYREKAKEDGKYIMYMESIGYSIYGGKIPNASVLSNYKFFCENTKSFAFHPEWTKYGSTVPGSTERYINSGGSKNVNALRRIEEGGILSEKKTGKYNFRIDSSYFKNNSEILVVNFKGNNDNGQIWVVRGIGQILQIKVRTNKVYSSIPIDNQKANVVIKLNYFGNVPFVSRMETNYKSKGLEYVNTLTILLQKLNHFELSKEEYWSINMYSGRPYV